MIDEKNDAISLFSAESSEMHRTYSAYVRNGEMKIEKNVKMLFPHRIPCIH